MSRHLARIILSLGALLAWVPSAQATYGGAVVNRSMAGTLAYYTVAESNQISECSGGMIARNKIITAAHCVRSERRYGRVQVVGRRARIGNPGRAARAARIVRVAVHPRYNRLNPQAGYDMAVLTLSRPVGSPIELATPGDEAGIVESGEMATFAGFGVTPTSRGWNARPARSVSLEVLEPYNCVVPSQ
ncbi:trypsin-like serine protease, partial [Mycobacterium sp.]|uniref:trypsin-like serine protease n=1 Tax=Mycobacterium sp. TaxID=1785 RepID=UPI003A86765C